jgi:hypothetical protein
VTYVFTDLVQEKNKSDGYSNVDDEMKVNDFIEQRNLFSQQQKKRLKYVSRQSEPNPIHL